MKRYYVDIRKIIPWIVFILFSVPCFLRFLSVMKFQPMHYEFWLYGISDWLINYEGGFVRRGILGQILWITEQIHLFDPRIAILVILIASSILILLLMVRIFKKDGWSLLILPTGFCFGYILFNIEGRRDSLSLILTFFVFILYRKLMFQSKKWQVWFSFYILSIFQILMQEASFFYTFPLLMLCCYMNMDGRIHSKYIKMLKCVIQFLPILIAMFAVCVYKGNENVVYDIWNSWKGVISFYATDSSSMDIGWGVKALAWNSSMTFKNHLSWAYLGYNYSSYWNILFVFFNWMTAYYLVTRINAVDMGLYPKKLMDNVLMSDVVLLQFVAMLPMFTFLSCDWGRTMPYWVISSLFFFHIFKHDRLRFPYRLTKMSMRIQNYITHNRFLQSHYAYILLILLSPVPFCFAPLDGVTLQGVIYDMIVKKIKLIVFLL